MYAAAEKKNVHVQQNKSMEWGVPITSLKLIVTVSGKRVEIIDFCF